MPRNVLRFLRRGRVVELASVAPGLTLLDYLRLEERATGTKEGCNEGDCGACTVALGRLRNGHLVYEAVNACILLLAQIDGCELVTVEDLGQNGSLHPVQQAMVEFHGSQCGFCTPGIVMSLFTLYHSGAAASRQDAVDCLTGNLCRCTGYHPITGAAVSACAGAASDQFSDRANQTAAQLRGMQDSEDLFLGSEQRFFAAPATAAAALALLVAHPSALPVAGATDVGLWLTKQLRDLPQIIHLGRVQDMRSISSGDRHLTLGAAVTYAEAGPHLAAIDDDLGELVRRLGSKQVRASGTIGGNIANGSPIGDMPPALIALGCIVTLASAAGRRSLPLEDYFIDYGKQDRRPDELVFQLEIAKLSPGEHFRCFKITKRFDQDISAVMGGFKLALDGDRITAARVAFGGMAATPMRARHTEAALIGAFCGDPQSWQPALAALAEDYRPISDMRASAEYRARTARNLLRKVLHELAGAADTRITGMRSRHAVPA